MKKKLFFLFFCTILPFSIFCEAITQIDFYGIASKDAEKNMLLMTEDVFFAQLKELKFNILDKRYDNFSDDFFNNLADFSSSSSPETRYFYATILKLESGKWEVNFYLNQYNSNKQESDKKIYDSYYKILMESKINLQAIVENLAEKQNKTGEEKTLNEDFTLESLAGSWNGGKDINKIILMRGGRGFVIFKNGASMNISLKIKTDENGLKKIEAVQTSLPNASFFPEIDRKKALENAANEKPILWNLDFKNQNLLSGTVETLIQNEAGEVIRKELPAEWKKY